MNKTAIKNFATWARKKLIADITYKASLMGITDQGIKATLPQSMPGAEAYDIGTKEPYVISGDAVRQRAHLARLIQDRAKGSDYQTAFHSVVEEVAYTWFNRLIAIRFMEVNDYMPDHIRVLSSENGSKLEPDMVTTPFDTELEFTEKEKQQIIQLKNENAVDELFQMLFIKECNSLNQYLPRLFEKTSDYTELLLNVSITDKEGVVYHLVHDIDEQDFDINNIGEDGRPTGQVEIIGWLYQYYNAELKDETFALLKKNKKITKERIPSATQLFTPDWIVRYMVENSLGRVWLNGHPNDELKKNWIYYIDEAKQEPGVEAKRAEEQEEYKKLKPEDLTLMDPSMGSGHILVYGFDVLMQIYTSVGYSERDAAQSILKNNLYGLDIDERAFQLAYFAVMMKGRQYDRRILTRGIEPHVYGIEESNDINREHLKFLGNLQDEVTRKKNQNELLRLLDQFIDAKIYGSIIKVEGYDFDALREYVYNTEIENQISIETLGLQGTLDKIAQIINISKALQRKYLSTVTNPPYMGGSGMNSHLADYVKRFYFDCKADLFAVFITLCRNMRAPIGYSAMITQHSWMFLPSFQSLRDSIISDNISSMLHLGTKAFDGADVGTIVQTTAFVLGGSNTGCFIRLVDFPSSQEKRLACIRSIRNTNENLFIRDKSIFSMIPGHPVAYWVSNKFAAIFDRKTIGEYAISDGQTKTGNNDKYLRNIWEVDANKVGTTGYKWVKHVKGGPFRKWYGNIDTVIDWSLQARNHYKTDHVARITPEYLWFRKGLSWTLISEHFSIRLLTDDCTFNLAAPSLFFNNEENIYPIIGYLNSKVASSAIKVLNPTFNTNIGDVCCQPADYLNSVNASKITKLVKQNIEISKGDWDSFETSWDFRRNPLVPSVESWEEQRKSQFRTSRIEKYSKLEFHYNMWKDDCLNRFNELKKNEEELNDIFINMYGLQGELSSNESDDDVTVRKADLSRDIRSLISYAVGCMFGRYSLDVDGLAYAGGDWDASKYSTFIPDADNVIPITDEEYLDDDIVGLLIQWLKKVYGEDTLEENLDFIAKALGNKGNTSREIIRNYFLTDFFKDHCQTYSVTGSGKRPIYWLYDSGKQNGFKALIYMHRYNEDTTGVVRVKYLHRMEQIYTSEIDRMQDTIDHSKSAHDVSVASKRKEKLQKQLKECRDYDEKIAHLALDRIAIDLDDGVKVNYRKVQTGSDGKFYEVLADSKNIMSKQ